MLDDWRNHTDRRGGAVNLARSELELQIDARTRMSKPGTPDDPNSISWF